MKRYNKLVLEAEEGITFEVSKGTSGELINRALNIATTNVDLIRQTESAGEYAKLQAISAGEYANTLSVYTDNEGNKAVVPPGWTVSGVCKENIIWGKDVSLVIYRIPKEKVSGINWEDIDVVEGLKRTYDQFVWILVGNLDSNGTLDGEHFSEKFGRINYQDNEFSDSEFNEALNGELLEQLESIKKYGGFYISRYNISESSARKPQSVKGVMPWVNIDSDDAKGVVSTIEDNEVAKSHLTFCAEYSMLEWFIKSNARTHSEIAEDSTNWGNHRNTKNSPRKVVETGSSEEWCTNNIYDIVGNDSVIRGGICKCNWNNCSVAFRLCDYPLSYYNGTDFRATLYIK